MKKIAVIAPADPEFKTFENTCEGDALFEKIKDLLKGYSEGLWLLSSLSLGFETLAATAVLRLKEEYPVFLECVIPFEEQAKDFPEADRDRYFYILEKCDKETLLQTRYSSDTEEKRLRYMTEAVDEIITYGELPLKARTIITESGKKIIKL